MTFLKKSRMKLRESLNLSTSKKRKIAIYSATGVSVVAALMILPEIALAAKFDIDAGVTAGTAPFVKALSDHWGKAVLLSGGGAAIVGEGDGRQRAVRALIAAGSAGGAILGLLAMLT
jgi:hypothetical protein